VHRRRLFRSSFSLPVSRRFCVEYNCRISPISLSNFCNHRSTKSIGKGFESGVDIAAAVSGGMGGNASGSAGIGGLRVAGGGMGAGVGGGGGMSEGVSGGGGMARAGNDVATDDEGSSRVRYQGFLMSGPLPKLAEFEAYQWVPLSLASPTQHQL